MDEADQSDQHDRRAVGSDRAEQVRDQALSAPTPQLFGFAQVEVPWPLGPADGRHVLRDGRSAAITHVVVLATLGAPRRQRLVAPRRGRTRGLPAEPDPAPVTTGRATVVNVGRPLSDEQRAQAWLGDAGEPELDAGLEVLARVLQAHRLVTADPAVVVVTREQLIAARVGYGAGEQVADGRWRQARELTGASDRGRAARRRTLDSGTRLAAVLAGEDRPLICEELILRARADLDLGRPRAAALQLLVALDAAIAEIARDPRAPVLSDRLADLRDRRDPVARAAQAALAGDPDAEQQRAVAEAIARVQAAVRSR